MAEQPDNIQTEIGKILANARHENETKTAQSDAEFRTRVDAEALKVAKALAPDIACNKTDAHHVLPGGQSDDFYRALADVLREHEIHVSRLLLATNGETLKGMKEKNDWDGTTLNYSYYAHFGPPQAIIRYMQGYDPRDEGEVVETY